MTTAKAIIPNSYADDADFAAIVPSGEPHLGQGTTRTVYAIPGHTDKVVKVAIGNNNRANWAEAVIYEGLTDKTGFGKVCAISRSGKYLVMERLDNLTEGESEKQQIPAWLTDRKRDNLGRSPTGEVKIRDYALVNLTKGVLQPMPSKEEKDEMQRLKEIVR